MSFRYHVVSLVAVFIALGLGMLLGATLMTGDEIVSRQQALIDRLITEFEGIIADRDALAQVKAGLELEVAQAYRFSAEVMPYLVKDRLRGRSASILMIGRDMGIGLDQALRGLGSAVCSLGRWTPSADYPLPPGELVAAILQGDADSMSVFAQEGAVEYDALRPGPPETLVVLIADNADVPKVDRAIPGLIQQARGAGIRVVVGYSKKTIPRSRNHYGADAAVIGADGFHGLIALALSVAGVDGVYGGDRSTIFPPFAEVMP